MSNRYSIYSASFAHAGGTLDLRQLTDQGARSNSRVSKVRPGGSLDVGANILSTANPSFTFGTTDLLSIASLVHPATGLYCSGGHTARYQQRLAGGAFATGSSHMTQVTPHGYLAVDSITADIESENGAAAALSYMALSSDGSNPISQTVAADFTSAPTPLFASQYYLGGVWYNSIQLLGLIRSRVVPGLRFGARRSDGGVFPRASCSSLLSRTPVIECSFFNLALAEQAVSSFFLGPMAGALDVYLQRGTEAVDGRVAAATASHIRYRASTGSLGFDDITVRAEEDGTATMSVMPTSPLDVAVGVAMPT